MRLLTILTVCIAFAASMTLTAQERTAVSSAADNQASADLSPGKEEAANAEPAATADSPAPKKSGRVDDKGPSDWKVTIYPIWGWAPLLGASINLPTFPELPPGTAPSGANVNGSFDGAALAGYRIEKSGWSTTGNFLWAGLSADQDQPKAHLGLDVIFAQLMGGREVLPHLSLEGGVRRMALKISAQAGSSPEVSSKPGVWDPLIGMTYRREMGRKWRLTAHLDGGGFGAGSDVTLSGTGTAEWQFAKHFGLTFGYSALHFKISSTVADRINLQSSASSTVTVNQTMHGPIFGFGIYF